MTEQQNLADFRALHAALGIPFQDSYDTLVMLGIIREQRRRHAGKDDVRATEQLTAGIRDQLRIDVPIDRDTTAQIADVLIALSGYLVSFAAQQVPATAIVNVLAFLGDDLAQEAGL